MPLLSEEFHRHVMRLEMMRGDLESIMVVAQYYMKVRTQGHLRISVVCPAQIRHAFNPHCRSKSQYSIAYISAQHNNSRITYSDALIAGAFAASRPFLQY